MDTADLEIIAKIIGIENIVEIVLVARYVRVVPGLDRRIRDNLDIAVKYGRLGHVKKSGFKGEFYYSPSAEWLVMDIRENQRRECWREMEKVFGW